MESPTLTPPLLPFIPPDAKVLIELGCHTGSLGEQYKRINPHSQYIGIEPNAEAAQIAAPLLDRVIPSEIESLDLAALNLSAGTIDCIVYNDTLTQLTDPWTTLRRHAAWLKEGGQVLACIPNVQHWTRILNLLRGQWQPQNPNLATQDELRFFALDSIKTLFNQAGLQIYDIQPITDSSPEFQQFQQLLAPVVNSLGLNPTRFATQTSPSHYIVRATRSPIPPRRLLIQTVIMAPSGRDRVRVYDPDRFNSTTPGVRTLANVKFVDLDEARPEEEKVLIWQGAILQYPQEVYKQKELVRRGYLIVAEFDDDPLDTPDYEKNQFFTFRGCHCVQTTNELLASYLRELNPNVAVFPNQLAYLPPPRIYQEQSITLFFGALHREKDWQPLMPVLNRVLNRYQDRVQVKVIHDRLFFDALETPHKEFEPFCPYERYEAIMRSCDIGILPLLPTRYNSMKSDLKFIQCAGHGVAVLASPTVYEHSIREGETGLIYRSVEEFEAKLVELIENQSLRRQLAANAYEYVRNNRLLCQHYHQRRDWYLQMRDELPRLNQELRGRFPELFQD